MTARGFLRIALPAGLAAGLPGLALAAPLTPAVIFANAAPAMQLLMLALPAATLAAGAVTAVKLAERPHPTGGSAYLSALRLGGPLVGLLGAVFNGLTMCMGLARGPQPFDVVAPGLAEAALLALLGLVAGVTAVIGHAAVEARIDRAALRG